MRNVSFIPAVALAVTVAAGAADVNGQVSQTDTLAQLRADIQADRLAVVAANLRLTDAEGAAFWPLCREYRGELAKGGDRLQELIQDFAAVYDTATAEQARTLVDELMAIQRTDLKVKEAYLPKFRKVLPEVKVARFLQIENKLDSVIRLGLAAEVPLIGTTK
jgi:hypothetical protein